MRNAFLVQNMIKNYFYRTRRELLLHNVMSSKFAHSSVYLFALCTVLMRGHALYGSRFALRGEINELVVLPSYTILYELTFLGPSYRST